MHIMATRTGSSTLWFLYFQLTVFYILAVLLSFNVTSSSLNGIVLVIQCITSPVQINIMQGVIQSTDYGKIGVVIVKIVLSIVCIAFGFLLQCLLSFLSPS